MITCSARRSTVQEKDPTIGLLPIALLSPFLFPVLLWGRGQNRKQDQITFLKRDSLDTLAAPF